MFDCQRYDLTLEDVCRILETFPNRLDYRMDEMNKEGSILGYDEISEFVALHYDHKVLFASINLDDKCLCVEMK